MTRKTQKTVKEDVGERIEELLRLSGKTQKDFAAALNIGPRSVSLLVNGKTFPNSNNLRQIAKFLRVDVWDLFDTRPTRKMPKMLRKKPQKRMQVVRTPKQTGH